MFYWSFKKIYKKIHKSLKNWNWKKKLTEFSSIEDLLFSLSHWSSSGIIVVAGNLVGLSISFDSPRSRLCERYVSALEWSLIFFIRVSSVVTFTFNVVAHWHASFVAVEEASCKGQWSRATLSTKFLSIGDPSGGSETIERSSLHFEVFKDLVDLGIFECFWQIGLWSMRVSTRFFKDFDLSGISCSKILRALGILE